MIDDIDQKELTPKKRKGMLRDEERYAIKRPKHVKKVYLREGDLLKECREYLKSREDLFFRRVEGAGKLYGGGLVASEMKGFPDLLIVQDGQLIGAELKIYGGHLTESQALTLRDISRAGGVAGVVLSLPGLRRMLDAFIFDFAIQTKFGEIMAWI